MRFLPLLTTLTCVALASPALAQGPSFTAKVEQNQVGLGEPFTYEITLSAEEGDVENYRRPDFRGVRVVGEFPSQSTQVQMGGGGTFMRRNYSWRYELIPLQKGKLTIGPATIRVGNRDLRTASVTVNVVDGGQAAPAPQRRARGIPGFPGFPFPGMDLEPEPEPEPPPVPTARPGTINPTGQRNFVAASASKTKVYVGEPILAEWTLYLTQRQDKYAASKEPRTDGFWVEDLQIPTRRGGLSLAEQVIDGRAYLVGPLLRKALFPLSAGTHTVTPLEADISRIDIFGNTLRSEHLKSEPLVIEVLPLPSQGRPANFDSSAVGTFTFTAVVDRTQVNVGDALTLTLQLAGRGNLRKLVLPAIPKLDGAKIYDPKIDVAFDPGENLMGSKRAEYLLLPERPGPLVIPALTFTAFDPEKGTYQTQKTNPIQIEVTGQAPAAAPTATSTTAPRGTENLIALDLRPPRNRPSLRRDLGTTLFGSSTFWGLILAPPGLLLSLSLVQVVRSRLRRETDSTRHRKLRRQADRRLRTAATYRSENRPSQALTEIERVLRDYLTGKLGQPVSGMSRDELRSALARIGASQDVVECTVLTFDTCDRARFAPGSISIEEASNTMDKAGEILAAIDRLNLGKST